MSLIHEVCHFCWRDINKPEERETAFFIDAYSTETLKLGQHTSQTLTDIVRYNTLTSSIQDTLFLTRDGSSACALYIPNVIQVFPFFNCSCTKIISPKFFSFYGMPKRINKTKPVMSTNIETRIISKTYRS